MRVSIAIENFQSIRHALVSTVYYRDQNGWAGESFYNEGSQKAGKHYFQIGFLQIQYFIREPYCKSFKQNSQTVC